jgi:hypothetical protein
MPTFIIYQYNINTSLLFLLKKCWLANWCTIKEIADIKIATLSKIFLIWQLIYYPRACCHPHWYSVHYYVYSTMYTLWQSTFTNHLINYPIACWIYQLMHYWREYWYSNEYSLKHVIYNKFSSSQKTILQWDRNWSPDQYTTLTTRSKF